jgi:hypothetical protein
MLTGLGLEVPVERRSSIVTLAWPLKHPQSDASTVPES